MIIFGVSFLGRFEIFLKRNWLLIVILLLATVMRTYNYEKSFSFAHDQDLYSWIVKDIVVNKHLRLVGQITSVDGVFIGPLYYYIMALSYFVSGMNPMSAIVPTTLIGLLTVISFYYLGNKYFSRRTGLIMAFIYAVSFGAAYYDRWSVPTEPTILWSVWFMYVLLGLCRKDLKLLPLFGVLAALTYHIHIALVPLLPVAILAYFISGGRFKQNLQKIKVKNVLVTVLFFFVVSSPFWLFEIKHNFSQIKSVLIASEKNMGNPTGIPKLLKVVETSSFEMHQRLLIGWQFEPIWMIWLVLALMMFYVYKKKKIKTADFVSLLAWIFMIGLAQFWSKRGVSEYYFTNYVVIFILIPALFFNILWEKKYFKSLVLLLAIIYASINFYWLLKKTNQITNSYYYRRQVLEYIKKDQIKNNYPCIGINFIAPLGENVGFRYLWWFNGVNVIKPSGKVPTYNIVIPWETSANEIDTKIGRFGIILPSPFEDNFASGWCGMSENQLDQLLLYTE